MANACCKICMSSLTMSLCPLMPLSFLTKSFNRSILLFQRVSQYRFTLPSDICLTKTSFAFFQGRNFQQKFFDHEICGMCTTSNSTNLWKLSGYLFDCRLAVSSIVCNNSNHLLSERTDVSELCTSL